MNINTDRPPTSDPLPPGVQFEELADRVREVRRQLSRSGALAGVLDHHHKSPNTLRAVQRLDSAIRQLSDAPLPRRLSSTTNSNLSWLVRVVEKRAEALEMILEASRPSN